MAATILDQELEERLIEERRAAGADRFDEVWDGVYIMSPMPNVQHQMLVGKLNIAFGNAVDLAGLGETFPGVSVSDRKDDWTKNYRCPDVAVYLNGNTAENCDAFWYGGPDFAVEIVSPGDRTREKLDFYANVGTRELLIVDREPWALELYRLTEGRLRLVGKSTLESSEVLASDVVPLTFRLQPGTGRPTVDVRHADGRQQWMI